MNITLEDIAKNFGCNQKKFSLKFIEFFNSLNLNYEELNKNERDQIILEILNKLDNDKQKIGSPERTDIWYNGWKENLDGFIQTKNLNEIIPKFIRPNNIVRFNGNFIKPKNSYFEKDFAKLIQIFCYDNYIKNYNVDNVYEFGCGSCFNLINIINLDHALGRSFYGSDFVNSSVVLCNELSKSFNLKLEGFLFDMLKPDLSVEIKSNSCVFTFGAIEQLNSKFHNFIDYLIKNKPKICFHIEPTIENYNNDDLFDNLQIRFHKKRGYTEGLLPYLEKLEKEGVIKIVKNKRINFGSKFMEGYHLFAWEMV